MTDLKNIIEDKAKLLWGQDLHKSSTISPHSYQLQKVFPRQWSESLRGSLLEIGCGSGSDLKVFASMSAIKSITAIDIGSNIQALSKKYESRKDITVQTGNALSLEFNNESFDVIYSFGVFHHTSKPIRCFEESARVLKKSGKLFLYLYSSHEDLFFKRIGILIEKLIMRIFHYFPYKLQSIICVCLSPICWLVFTLPSVFFNFAGYKNIGNAIPFHTGRHPFSLIGDLKDRLMSPINHRFTKKQIEKILVSLEYQSFEVVKRASGLYIYAKK